MGGKIPEPIRREVISQWLHGKTRDLIAKDNSIGTGTVSEIINQYRQRDSDFDLMRQVALTLKDQQTDLRSFSAAIRLRRILEEAGLSEDDIESLIVNAEVYCFKHEMDPTKFFDIVDNVYTFSNKNRISLDEIPQYIIQQEKRLEQLKQELEDTQMNKDQALQDYNITIRDLDEYRKNRPLIDRLLELVEVQEKLYNLTKQQRDYFHERFIGEKAQWLVSEHELDQANKQLHNYPLLKPIDADELFKLAKELFDHPTEYIGAIDAIRHKYYVKMCSRILKPEEL